MSRIHTYTHMRPAPQSGQRRIDRPALHIRRQVGAHLQHWKVCERTHACTCTRMHIRLACAHSLTLYPPTRTHTYTYGCTRACTHATRVHTHIHANTALSSSLSRLPRAIMWVNPGSVKVLTVRRKQNRTCPRSFALTQRSHSLHPLTR